jgi:hypothetical protein
MRAKLTMALHRRLRSDLRFGLLSDLNLIGFGEQLPRRPLATLTTTGKAPRPFARIIAVMIRPNPTYDYYIAPRLRSFPGLETVICYLSPDKSRLPDAIFKDALILFIRYTSSAWLDLIERYQGLVAGTALLLDDDLASPARESGLPLHWRWRFFRNGVMHWPRLGRLLDRVFVSTPSLLSRLPQLGARLLPPIGDESDLRAAPRPAGRRLRVAYHATSIHPNESRWLMPVAAQLLAENAALDFEVVAQGGLAAGWRRIARASIMPPLPWPEYRKATAARAIDIMLAPLLPTELNAARAPTKRIDAARSGAALLVSDPGVYNPSAAERALGMQVDLDRALWARAITELARDPDRIRKLACLNREQLAAAQATAPPLLVEHREGGRRLWRFREP